MWGANAVNGVINIITRSASDSRGLLLRAGSGNELRGMGAIRYGGQIGESANYRVYGQHSDRDGVSLASGADAPNNSEASQAGFRLDWLATGSDSVTLQGDANESRTQGASRDSVSRYQNILARWTRMLPASGSLQLQSYYDRAYRFSPGAYRDQLDTLDIELEHRFRAGATNEIVWGLTYRSIEDDFDNGLFIMNPSNESLHRWGGFVENQITLSADRLYLTLGTKAEDNEYTGTEWQPSASLSWRYRPGQLLWGRISRAARTPSRLDRSLTNATRPPFTVGSDSFDSEQLVAYEAGLKLQPLTGLSVSLATYYNEYDDIRSFERANPLFPIPLVISNRLEGDAHGAELFFNYRLNSRWRIWGGYSYLDLDLSRKSGSTDPLGGAGEARDWRHQGFLRGSLDLAEGLEFDAELRRIGAIENHRLPAYTELNVRIGWQVTRSVEFSLTGTNLLESEHAEFGPPGRMLIERSAHAQFTWTPQ
jgi:iron complex outermembrane receptor protein